MRLPVLCILIYHHPLQSYVSKRKLIQTINLVKVVCPLSKGTQLRNKKIHKLHASDKQT